MPNLSLTNYDPRIAELQRQQKLAELLQTQSQQPIQIQSYKGIQAPISPLEGLAKVLQAYASASKGKKLAKEEGDIQTGQRTEAMDTLKRLTSPTQSDLTTMPAPSGPLEGNQGLLAALKGRMGLSPPPAAPSMPPPPQMAPAPPPQAMAPPPPQPSPEGITPAGPPQMAVDPNPQLRTTPEGPPVSHATSPQDRQQMALEAMVSGNPYLKDIAPTLYAQAAKEVETARMAAAMNSTGLPADLQAAFRRHVAGGDLKGAMALVDKASEPRVIGGQLVQRNLETGKYDTLLDTKDKWEQVDLPKDVQAMTQPGTIVLKSSNGDIKTIKLSDAESAAKMAQDLHKIGIQQGPAWANVAINRERENRMSAASANGGGADWQEAINQAVGDGRLDLKGINSRNAPIIGRALLANPGMSAIQLHAVANVTANPAYQQRAKALEALPDSLKMVEEAGSKLNFSDFKPLGTAQAVMKDVTNDPDFRNYMAKRNDALQRLAYAMRGVGMSDNAVNMELKAAPEAMSPRGFKAWYSGQMEMVNKQLEHQAVFGVGQGGKAAPPAAPAQAGPYADPGKEARYQAWLKSRGH